MSDEQETLEDLLVDEEEINKQLLTQVLSDYIRIGRNSGGLMPQPRFEDLTSRRKVAVVLLAQKARFELDMVDKENLGPTEISEQSGIKKGTVYPAVRDLESEGIAENDDGSYRIPAYNFEQAKRYIRGGDD